MLDSGSTHNFIDAMLVEKRGLQTEKHEGFDVRVSGGTNLSSTHKVPKLSIILGNYTVTDDFYVIDLADTNVVLGIQCMEILDEYTQSFKRLEFSFKIDDKKVVLRGMSNGGSKIISAKRMEAIFRHGDVACKTWEDNLKHIDIVLAIMESQSLYAKDSKCEFGMTKIMYLGHMISAIGVHAHQENIRVILDWPPPRNLTDL
ncbi:uncharacterized protein LOC131064868 [Cryptomeria japonica]|uniref:uncharacterized protein LOC131064868 n=1 Tax=Cryptomeria japonica TaxID=3369 RepID=UPI0025AC5840|nr:uncharacterized protein LOC131064868 [Cryptomeria japonica]